MRRPRLAQPRRRSGVRCIEFCLSGHTGVHRSVGVHGGGNIACHLACHGAGNSDGLPIRASPSCGGPQGDARALRCSWRAPSVRRPAPVHTGPRRRQSERPRGARPPTVPDLRTAPTPAPLRIENHCRAAHRPLETRDRPVGSSGSVRGTWAAAGFDLAFAREGDPGAMKAQALTKLRMAQSPQQGG